MNGPAPDIDVRDVVKIYGGARAVDGVSFGVERGKILSLLGPSGGGKTTVMRMIAGLARPDGGEIFVKGKALTNTPVHRRNIGMLFQNYALFPHLDVAGNIAFGLEMRGVARADLGPGVERALAMVKLGGFAARMPHQLSGGQQQRVALARALVIEPSALLLDEPFGALDRQLRETMQVETRDLQRRLGITTLMVTHDQEEALTLSDYVAVMRAGRIEQLGTPGDIYERPVSRFVAGFIGTSNFITGRVTKRRAEAYLVESADGIILEVPGAAPLAPAVTLALRPEAIRLAAPGPGPCGPNAMRGALERIIYRGLNTHLSLRRPGGETLEVIRQNGDGSALPAGLCAGAVIEASWAAERNRAVTEDAP